MKPVLRDQCHERPLVLKDHIFLTEGRTFNVIEPVIKDHLSSESTFLWPFKTGSTVFLASITEGRMWQCIKAAFYSYSGLIFDCMKQWQTINDSNKHVHVHAYIMYGLHTKTVQVIIQYTSKPVYTACYHTGHI